MAGRVRGALLTAALVAALASAALAGTAAAAGFVADETLSAVESSAPDVAMAPNGYAAASWVEDLGGGQRAVRVALRPPGGGWSSQVVGRSALAMAAPDVAVDAGGDAVVSWQETNAMFSPHTVVATRPAGGAFGAAEHLPDGTFNAAVGIDASGRATLLYTASSNVVVRDFQAGASALAAPQVPVAAGCFAQAAGIAVAPSGDAVAGFNCSGATFALRRAGVWAVSATVPSSGGSCVTFGDLGRQWESNSVASVAIDSQGHPVGALIRHRFTCVVPPTASVESTVRLVLPAGGRMAPLPDPAASSSTLFGTAIFGARAVVSPAGLALAWMDASMPPGQNMVRAFALDGVPSGAAQPLGTPASRSTVAAPALALDGRALAAWVQGDSTVASERPASASAFGPPLPVGPAGPAAGLQVAMDDAGNGVVVWTQGAGPALVHARGYDAAPPELSGVAIPPTAAMGAPASFAASAFDMWGPVALSWSFGDGLSATGPTASHAYAAPGSFTATVAAIDAAGNATSRSGVVQVAGAAGPTPPALSQVSLTNRAFRVGRAATAVSAARRRPGTRRRARAPVGTTIRFTLDRAATVTIAFARQASGLRARGGRCVAPSRRLRRARARRCTRVVPVRGPGLTRGGRAGANAVPFSGRIGRRALAPGRYRASLTPAADGRAGQARTVAFRVVR